MPSLVGLYDSRCLLLRCLLGLRLLPQLIPQQFATEDRLKQHRRPLLLAHRLRLAPPHECPPSGLHHEHLEDLKAFDAIVVELGCVLHRMALSDACAQVGGLWLKLLTGGRHEASRHTGARRLDQERALPHALVPYDQRRATLELTHKVWIARVERHKPSARERRAHRRTHSPRLEYIGADPAPLVGAVLIADLVDDPRQPITQACEHNRLLDQALGLLRPPRSTQRSERHYLTPRFPIVPSDFHHARPRLGNVSRALKDRRRRSLRSDLRIAD